MRYRSVTSLVVVGMLAAGCFPVGQPAGQAAPASSLSGTSWVLDSGSNAPIGSQPATASSSSTPGSGRPGSAQPGVTQAGAPAPVQADWLLPDRGTRPTLTFSAGQNSVSGSTGCNRYFGSFAAGSTDLSVGGLATTMMMCFDSLAVQEIAYLDALSNVSGYANNGTSLTLTTSDGRQLVFTPLSTSVDAQAATYRYVCEGGLYFTATYDPDNQRAAIQLSTGASDALKQEATGAMATYASARHRLQAKGNEALLDTLQDGRMHRCVAPLSPQK